MLIDIHQQLRKIDHFIAKYGINIHLEKYNNDHNHLIYYITISRTDTKEIKTLIKNDVYPNIIKILGEDAPDKSNIQLDWLYVDHNKMKTVLELKVPLKYATDIDQAQALEFFKGYFGDSIGIVPKDRGDVVDFTKIVDIINVYIDILKSYQDTIITNYNKERSTIKYNQKWNDLALQRLLHNQNVTKPIQQTGGVKITTSYVNLTSKGTFNYIRNLSKQVVFRPDIEETHIGLAIKFTDSESGAPKNGIIIDKKPDGYQVATSFSTPTQSKTTEFVREGSVLEINYPIDNRWNNFNHRALFKYIASDTLLDLVQKKLPKLSSLKKHLKNNLDQYILQNPTSILAHIIQQDRYQYLLDLKDVFVV